MSSDDDDDITFNLTRKDDDDDEVEFNNIDDEDDVTFNSHQLTDDQLIHLQKTIASSTTGITKKAKEEKEKETEKSKSRVTPRGRGRGRARAGRGRGAKATSASGPRDQEEIEEVAKNTGKLTLNDKPPSRSTSKSSRRTKQEESEKEIEVVPKRATRGTKPTREIANKEVPTKRGLPSRDVNNNNKNKHQESENSEDEDEHVMHEENNVKQEEEEDSDDDDDDDIDDVILNHKNDEEVEEDEAELTKSKGLRRKEHAKEDNEEDQVEEEEEEEVEDEGHVEEEQVEEDNLSFLEKLKKAQHNLLLSTRPSSLPGREVEMDQIKQYVYSRLQEGSAGGGLNISGTPGTGKTASVREVISQLAKDKSCPNFIHAEINGLQLTQPSQLYVEIYKKLLQPKRPKRDSENKHYKNIPHREALDKLERTLTKATPTRKYSVLMVDEFDLLVTPKQKVIYDLLTWAHHKNAKLIVIAIANTMNLPSTLTPKVQSRLGTDRLDFKAYLRPALQAIIVSRLEKLQVFRDESILLIAAKIAAISGDARRALETVNQIDSFQICRRALKTAQKNFIADNATEEDASKYLVSMSHVDTALQQITPSHATILRNAVLHQKLFMCTIANEVKITGKEETIFQIIANKHLILCNYHNVPPPSWSTLASVCQHLGDMRFLKVGDAALDVAQPIRLAISTDDILLAVAEDPICKKWLNLE